VDYAVLALPIAMYAKKIFSALPAILQQYYKMDYVSVAQSDARCAHPPVSAPHAWPITTWFRMDANLAPRDVWLALFCLDIHALLAQMGIFSARLAVLLAHFLAPTAIQL
jgi:hypothetical protein